MAIRRTSSNSISNAVKLSTGFASAAIPNPPTIGTATATSDVAATVEYTAAVLGATASTFTATSNPGSVTGTGSSPITVTGLTASTAYTFTVTAGNANGTSAASSASNSITTSAALGAFESIQTVTSSSAFYSAQFNSIPQTYKHLQLRILYGESRTANDVDYLRVRVNGRSANYWRLVYGNLNLSGASGNAVGNDAFYSSLSAVSNGSTYTNTFGTAVLYFMDYTNTNKKPNLMGWTGVASSGGYVASAEAGMTSNTANEAITSIEVFIEPTLNFKAYSHVALYGIKG